jgi:HlyD family secretion protein
MKRAGILLAALAAAATIGFVVTRDSRLPKTQAGSLAAAAEPETIVAPGRIEPVSEEVKVSSEISGRLSSVPLEEGDTVHRGQVIAAIANEDYRARLISAEAQVKLREAELLRVTNGSREQERREAFASVKEAEAALENAKLEQVRKQELYRSGVVSRSEADRADRESEVARARYDAAREHHALVNAEAREDDRMRAEAELAAARGRLLEAKALLEKTAVRSPIDGVILKKHLHTGESISDLLQSPIYTLGNISVLRARVDVDERDVARLRVGQPVWLTAEAYGEKRFEGHIVRVGGILGKQTIRSDEPTERVDKKILETLVELEPGSRLPVGLRVTCYLALK